MDQKREKTVCFTGHRSIPESDFVRLNKALLEQIQKQIELGAAVFRTGGAQGFDTMAALAVLSQKIQHPHIQLHLILPCPMQTKGWNENDTTLYEQIASRADKIEYVSPNYFKGVLQLRNRRLVEDADVCIAYLRATGGGGTGYTSALAVKQELEYINLQEIL